MTAQHKPARVDGLRHFAKCACGERFKGSDYSDRLSQHLNNSEHVGTVTWSYAGGGCVSQPMNEEMAQNTLDDAIAGLIEEEYCNAGLGPDDDATGFKASGMHHDNGKSRVDLIPTIAITGMGNALGWGAAKYEDRNWERGIEWHKIYGSAMRHLVAWWGREDNDAESGLSHLDHALANIAFLREFMLTHRELDDRPKGMEGGK